MNITSGGRGQSDTNRLLRGWKEIGRFFGKDERTVKRWEAERGLPVQRPGGGRGTVFADPDRLRAWLEGAPRNSRPADISPRAAQAKRLYLEGTYLWQKRTPASLSEAVKLLEQAVAIDPDYAQSFAALAVAHKLLGEYGPSTPRDAYPRALAAAERAVALDPAGAQGHTVLAHVEFFWQRHFDAALRRFEQARRLDPQLALTRHWYAEALLYAGRASAALAEIEAAQELDPQSRSILMAKAYILFHLGETAVAEQLLLQIVANEPDYAMPYKCLAFIALGKGWHARYLDMLDRLAASLGASTGSVVVAAGRAGLAAGGPTAMAREMLAAAETAFAQGRTPAYTLAHLHALQDDSAQAALCLAKALERREGDLFDYVIDPAFRHIRTEPQFQRKLVELGLPATA